MCFLKFPYFIMFPKWLLTAAVNSAYIMRQKYLRISSRFIHIIHYLKNVPTLTFLFYFPLFLPSFLHFSQISHRFTFHCTAPSFPTPSSSPSHLSSFSCSRCASHKLRWVFLHSLPPLPSLFALRLQ